MPPYSDGIIKKKGMGYVYRTDSNAANTFHSGSPYIDESQIIDIPCAVPASKAASPRPPPHPYGRVIFLIGSFLMVIEKSNFI